MDGAGGVERQKVFLQIRHVEFRGATLGDLLFRQSALPEVSLSPSYNLEAQFEGLTEKRKSSDLVMSRRNKRSHLFLTVEP